MTGQLREDSLALVTGGGDGIAQNCYWECPPVQLIGVDKEAPESDQPISVERYKSVFKRRVNRVFPAKDFLQFVIRCVFPQILLQFDQLVQVFLRIVLRINNVHECQNMYDYALPCWLDSVSVYCRTACAISLMP